MSPARDVCLTLKDVEEMILGFERQYGISSAEFFRNEEVRRTLPEDDVFQGRLVFSFDLGNHVRHTPTRVSTPASSAILFSTSRALVGCTLMKTSALIIPPYRPCVAGCGALKLGSQ